MQVGLYPHFNRTESPKPYFQDFPNPKISNKFPQVPSSPQSIDGVRIEDRQIKSITRQERKNLRREMKKREEAEGKVGEREREKKEAAEEQHVKIAEQTPIEKKGFILELLRVENARNNSGIYDQVIDKTYLAEDFRNSQLSVLQIGQRHVTKRLDSFFELARFVADNQTKFEEKGLTFPYPFVKGQFKVVRYVIPQSAHKRILGDFERAHISLFSKLVVNSKDQAYVIKGPLTIQKFSSNSTVKKIETTIEDFLNLCDVTSPLVNLIDWYAEYHLRETAYNLLALIIKEGITPSDAVNDLASAYGHCLTQLQDRIEKNNLKIERDAHLKIEFKNNLEKLFNHKKDVLKYINGMLEGILEFRSNL